ncbi:MAG: MFS transporter [Pseudomonadales bacterium]|nr:MFS transporter [Pseudomonadales bacterium]
MNRNLIVLTLAQSLGMCSGPLVILLGGILGAKMASSSGLATLPVAFMIIGSVMAITPATMIMGRFGRRTGFVIGSLVAVCGCLTGAYSIYINYFPLLCIAVMMIGFNMAVIQQYRFAAVENVLPENSSKAISLVMSGGILAAYVGPELVIGTQNWLQYGLYSGSFVALAVVLAMAGFVLLFYTEEKPEEPTPVELKSEGFWSLLLSPHLFLLAVATSAVAFGVMSLVMTATPVHMHVGHHFSVEDTAWVIQSHILAMFIPSLFSGYLISKLGVMKILVAGIGLLFAAVILAMTELKLNGYWSVLVLLGVGWNFLFTAGTTLLTSSYNPAQRYKAQAGHDLTVFGFQASAALLSGVILYQFGWFDIQVISMILLSILTLGFIYMRKKLAASTADSIS